MTAAPTALSATDAAPASDRVRVDLGERGYDILIGPGLLGEAGALCRRVGDWRHAFIVTDANVAAHHLEPVRASLEAAGLRVDAHVLPPGEEQKCFAVLERLTAAMLDARCERRSLVVALGGGVVGDLAGFAAAIVLRGVDFVQIPTTLLSQVDSSVGGKTGINTPRGKNLIGAFYQPRLVLADTASLDTLPEREMKAGYAEVAKYGLIDDPVLWDWLEAGGGAAVLAREPAALRRAIAANCRAKARIVAADEREGGVRALLNLGHTFSHALEAEAGYGGALIHGEGVAIGMVLAFDLSADLGLCPAADAARVRAHLAALGLPVAPPCLNGRRFDPDRLLAHMASDKKVHDGTVTFVLARGIGAAFLDRTVPPDAVRAVLARACAASVQQ